MKKIRFSILTFLLVGLLSSCNFINNSFKYQDTTKELVNDILIKDYDNAVKLFALEHISFAGTSSDTLKSRLPAFHDLLVSSFGDHVEFSFMTAEKKWTSDGNDQNLVADRLAAKSPTTTVMMQISNDKEFGVVKLLFDDISKKVLTIQILDVKEPIPNMLNFWLFGLLTLCIPIFNIYMIIKVKRSQFKKKWPKYLAIIFLNVPAITYNAISGLSFGLLSFQILLGASFDYTGYLNSSWTFGLPLGGLYILNQLHKGKDRPIPETTDQTIIADDIINPDKRAENIL